MTKLLQKLKRADQILGKFSFLASTAVLFSVSFLSYSQQSNGQQSNGDGTNEYYVSATASSNGDGTRSRPFNLLSQAELASSAGDTIYLIANDQNKPLDGGIALKSGQKLIMMGTTTQNFEDMSSRVIMTNTTAHLRCNSAVVGS